jgi:hypothetical protein
MGRKPKAPVNRWRRTVRKINGEKRHVKVLRKPDGRELVRVLFPKDKNISIDGKAKRLKGIAKGDYLNNKRAEQSKDVDKKQTADTVVACSDEGLEEWRKKPDRVDVAHVDTK